MYTPPHPPHHVDFSLTSLPHLTFSLTYTLPHLSFSHRTLIRPGGGETEEEERRKKKKRAGARENRGGGKPFTLLIVGWSKCRPWWP
ncbi:hypothetical protein Scep_010806 [Stephania cephalantha]|uniref:Uncharacterized protein n=1 Tax=Stephania cephalantha TaxID=152367 RepID=A0AAP0JWT4_9MAGN